MALALHSRVEEHQVEKACPTLTITMEEVRKLVNEIKTSKSSGLEGINASILKEAFMAIIPQVTDMFRKSLRAGTFPDAWAKSTVIPIPKAGSPKEISNWRPINLLPVPGRMLEKLVHTHIIKHVQDNKLLSETQYGFRTKHSTEH